MILCTVDLSFIELGRSGFPQASAVESIVNSVASSTRPVNITNFVQFKGLCKLLTSSSSRPLQPLEQTGDLTDIIYALTGSTGMYGSMSVDSSYVKAHRSAAGAKGGPSTMRSAARAAGRPLNPRADRRYRPSACHPDHPRQHGRCTRFDRHGPQPHRLLADRAYDARSLRDELAARRIKAVIPPNPTRKHPHRDDKTAYKGRNVIEWMFCRLKDFRRIATRYDKRADIFLSEILLAAAITWWIN